MAGLLMALLVTAVFAALAYALGMVSLGGALGGFVVGTLIYAPLGPQGFAVLALFVVVAVPHRPSPLTGSLLYQGVQRLTDAGVKAGMVEPALLHAVPEECERYARRLLERIRAAYRTA